MNILVSEKYKEKIHFKKDIFYISWNIIPIFLFFYWVIYIFLFKDIKYNISLIIPNIPIKHIIFNYNSWIILFIFILIILISILSVIIQINKQNKFENEKSYCYWWNKKINKTIFYSRLIFLFFNMFFFLYSFVLIVWLILTLFNIVNNSYNIIIIPNHYDWLLWLWFIGNLSIYLGLFFLLLWWLWLLWIVDHKYKQWLSHSISDTLLFLFWLFGILILFYPSYHIYKYNKYVNIRNSIINNMQKKAVNINKCNENYNTCNIVYNLSDTQKIIISWIPFIITLSKYWIVISSFILPLLIKQIPSLIEKRNNLKK